MKIGRTDKLVARIAELRNQLDNANDVINACYRENAQLIGELSRQSERYDQLVSVLAETVQAVLGKKQPVPGTEPASDRPAMPQVIRDAIDYTFPGDEVIQNANTAYAWSQVDRWADEAEIVAREIKEGATV